MRSTSLDQIKENLKIDLQNAVASRLISDAPVGVLVSGGLDSTAIVSNIIAGDYIMIVNSTTVPNIDGIHKVSSVHPTETNSFYIDTFIETSGNAPGIFVLRSSRFNTIADMNESLTRTAYYNWAEGDMAWTTKNSSNIDETRF